MSRIQAGETSLLNSNMMNVGGSPREEVVAGRDRKIDTTVKGTLASVPSVGNSRAGRLFVNTRSVDLLTQPAGVGDNHHFMH